MTRVLDEVNWPTISKDDPEAWLYFYEHLPEVYDNALRRQTGSYYTPPEDGHRDGPAGRQCLARQPPVRRVRVSPHPEVTLADPAMGTGTFLLGVLSASLKLSAG